MAEVTINGHCDNQFARVSEEFEANFLDRGELGASLVITIEGEKVVDLWGGVKSENGAEWQENTLCVVFSSTKGATALCAHILIDQEVFQPATLVSDIWPEFAQGGKENTTVAMMLDHSAAVPVFREPLRPQGILDWDYMVGRLAAEEAFWKPGTRNGYHGLNFGWTVGELVRRRSGKSLGQFFQTEIAEPLGIDFWIGLPAALDDRVAAIKPYRHPAGAPLSPFLDAVINQKGSIAGLFMRDAGRQLAGGFAGRDERAAEIGAANGFTNARGLAGMYSPLANDGGKLVSAETVQNMGRISMATHEDATLMIPTRFALGFMKSMDNRALGLESAILSEDAFGHVGAGGSIGFADPARRMSFGYVMNKLGPGLLLNPRGQSLIDAAYLC
jgi:CubicO group peptidase (beta-lactamase class C family)